jgi:hypothetical protein
MEEEEWFDNKFNVNETEETKKIEEDFDTKIEKVCSEFMFYLRDFSKENAIPLGENLDYIDLWNFLVDYN